MTPTAVLVCDMWDRHWCRSATERTAALAHRINEVLEEERSRGAFIIHAPSDTMRFYEETRQRQRMMQITRAGSESEVEVLEPPAPVTNHPGCPDDPHCLPVSGPPWPWTRQHPAIRIDEEDGISDEGAEVYNALRHLGIERLAFAGVHTDMCVLDRSFGIRAMLRRGVECVLLRDLTEAFWPKETERILDHIDRYLCPTLTVAAFFP